MDERAYEVRVAGLVPTQDLLDELGDVEVAEHEFRTVLTGHFPDQAALHGFLHRLRSFGLEVVEVRRVATSETEKQVGGTGTAAPTDDDPPPRPHDAAPTNHGSPPRRHVPPASAEHRSHDEAGTTP
jgi:hypothetical protein